MVLIKDKYIIRKLSNVLLFYVDRNKTKKYWWTYDLKYAMFFNSKDEAEKIATSFKHGNFEVITYKEAFRLRKETDDKYKKNVKNIYSSNFIYDDHPYSSEALGQS